MVKIKQNNSSKKKETQSNDSFVIREANKIVTYALGKSRPDKKKLQFPFWYAGITNNTKMREIGHKHKLKIEKLESFKYYYAYTFANARAIEKYLCTNHNFAHCALKGGAKDDTHVNPSKWVYIYFIPANLRK